MRCGCRARGTPLIADAYPPLKRWAFLFRPTAWDSILAATATAALPGPNGILGTLFSLLQLHAGGNGLAVAQDFHLHHFAHLTAAQRVGEIVEVVNRLAAELHQDVARFESCLRRWRSRPYVGKAHAVFNLAEVRNGAEIRPVASATAAHRLIFHHGDESWRRWRLGQLHRNVAHQIEQLRRRRRIDLVPGVGGL